MASNSMRPCRVCGKPFLRSRPDANREHWCSTQCQFLAKVDKAGPDECWNWMSKAKHRFGYGMMRVNRQTITAHRLAWEFAFGRPPDDLCVLHRCDNPPCCNPAHLFLGTHVDNIKDMNAKGRHGMQGRTHSPEARVKLRAARRRYLVLHGYALKDD